MVDNNILLSPSAIKTQSEGGAFVHNLIAGSVFMWSEPHRFTPYFLPHSTDVAGLSTVYSGDDRYFNNIFVGRGDKTDRENKYKYGLEGYNNASLPVFINDNVYYYGAAPYKEEKNYAGSFTYNPEVRLAEEGDNVLLYIRFDKTFYDHKVAIIDNRLLGRAKVPKAAFENPDGSSLIVDKDYFGNARTGLTTTAGPFTGTQKDQEVIKVW